MENFTDKHYIIYAAPYTRPSGHKLTSPGTLYSTIYKPAILWTVIKIKGTN